MHGCGNDFVIINGFTQEIKSPEAWAAKLANRHYGVGGDGVVLILPPTDGADAAMRMFNPDGSESQMCGNAIRCVAKYLYDNRLIKKAQMSVATLSGRKELWLTVENGLVASVKVNMGRAELAPERIPVKFAGESVVAQMINIGGESFSVTCLSMGNPHAVVFCPNVDHFDVAGLGPRFENDKLFPERVNAEFSEVIARNHLKVRVWERGCGETQACGTGACAAATAAVLNGFCDKGADIRVQLPGGPLVVNYTDQAVMMTGDCAKVFDGVIEIEMLLSRT